MTTVTSNSQLGSVKPCISHGKTNKRTRCAHRRPVCSLPPLGASPLFAELVVWPQADYPRGLEAIPSCRATGMLSAGLPCAGATETEENATEEEKASGERCHRSAYRPRARVNTPDCLPCAPSLRGGARARAPLCPLQACLHPERLFCPMLAGAELTDKGEEGGREEWGRGGPQPAQGVHSCARAPRPPPHCVRARPPPRA